MFDNDHLGLQENRNEEMTRPQFKRLIFEYLQKRDRKEIMEDLASEDGWIN